MCFVCLSGCGIEVPLDNGKVVKIQGDKDHSITRGHICPKGRAIGELVELSDHIKKSLKKDDLGKFREIEWSDNLDLLAG